MKQSSKDFLKLFFNEGENVCVSHNGYGYHSITQRDIEAGLIEQISPNEKIENETITDNDITLMSLNPVEGYRRDENVTAYRSFMVEMDDGTLEEQKKYIEESGLPYSYCCFSGNKSLHFGIVLDEDIPTYALWVDIAEWILNILDKADQMTKNPTRSIRFPDSQRKDGKQLVQQLVYMGERVSHNKLAKFLSKHPEKNPAEIRKRERPKTPRMFVNGIPKWVADKLEHGIDESKGRNNEWFAIAMELAKCGFDDEKMIDYCESYFEPERDFSLREWKDILTHAYKRVMRL